MLLREMEETKLRMLWICAEKERALFFMDTSNLFSTLVDNFQIVTIQTSNALAIGGLLLKIRQYELLRWTFGYRRESFLLIGFRKSLMLFGFTE